MPVAPRLILALVGLSASLTFLVSLCELILAGITQHRLHFARVETSGNDAFGVPTTSSNFLLPQYVLAGSNFVTGYSAGELGAAAVTIVSSVLIVGWTALSIIRRHSNPLAKDVTVAIAIFSTIAIIVNIGILAWIFSVHDGPGAAYVDTPPPASPGETQISLFEIGWSDTIDWEKYLCAIAPAVRNYEGGQWYATSCTYNVASRWTMVPLLILSFISGVLLWTAVGSMSHRNHPVEHVEKPHHIHPAEGVANQAA